MLPAQRAKSVILPPMKAIIEHPWNLTPKEAVQLQQQLRSHVRTRGHPRPKLVAGVDVGFEDHYRITRAAVAVLEFPSLTLCEHHIARLPTRFPYVPGLLSFRELPAVMAALAQLTRTPDLILCDGQGVAHPRRFGIASHLGVLTGLPTIGVGKTRLTGRHEEPGQDKGCWAPLMDGEEVIGAVLRTRTRVKPVYVSIGHRISLEAAVEIVLACTPKYRLPEPIRWAHRLASGLVELV